MPWKSRIKREQENIGSGYLSLGGGMMYNFYFVLYTFSNVPNFLLQIIPFCIWGKKKLFSERNKQL